MGDWLADDNNKKKNTLIWIAGIPLILKYKQIKNK